MAGVKIRNGSLPSISTYLPCMSCLASFHWMFVSGATGQSKHHWGVGVWIIPLLPFEGNIEQVREGLRFNFDR